MWVLAADDVTAAAPPAVAATVGAAGSGAAVVALGGRRSQPTVAAPLGPEHTLWHPRPVVRGAPCLGPSRKGQSLEAPGRARARHLHCCLHLIGAATGKWFLEDAPARQAGHHP
eukprot:7181844-Prymnesium_polylepis.2